MRRIDANAVLGALVHGDEGWQDEETFLSNMDYFDIDQAIVTHAMAKYADPMLGNAHVLEWAKKEPQRLIPCFVLAPIYKYHLGWLETEQLLKREQVRFVRLYPKLHGFSLGSALTAEMWEIASRLQLHLMMDYSEIMDESRMERPEFDQLLQRFPDVKVILTGGSHRRNWMMYSYLERYSQIYIEFSLINHWLAYEEVVKRFGHRQLLFGTNMPYNMPGPVIAMLAYADITADAKEDIAWRNSAELIGRGRAE